ncbi:MAG: metallophosphoesterase [Clostridia bacterium]|nr:metallophosphoesterase [Clostridia bacterium]
MIYVTGDTHIPIDVQKLSTKLFSEQKSMTKNDYVIICGDFGGVWDGGKEEKYWLKWLKNKNFTTLFIDGNHENFPMLMSFPTVDFAGGRAHRVDDGIYHLMRGEVYTLEGKTFFTMGGGESHDKAARTEGKNWWREEMPDSAEYMRAEENLKKCNFSVDYIITHSAPEDIQRKIAPDYKVCELCKFLQGIERKVAYKHWYFGHYHMDMACDDKHTAVFNERILI